MTKEFYSEFQRLRKKLVQYIKQCLEDDDIHKSYEGTWKLFCSYPSYFDDESATAKPDLYRISLHCYLISPNHHYHWDGGSWKESLEKSREDIEAWIAEDNDGN